MTQWGNDPTSDPNRQPDEGAGQPDPSVPPPAQADPWAQPSQTPPPQAPQYGQPPQGQPQQGGQPQYGQAPPQGQPGYGQAPQYGQPQQGGYPVAPGYSGYGQPMAPGAGSPASWWARFGARILDGLIIGIPLVIVSWIITAAFVDGGTRTCDEFGRCHVIDASGNAIIILWNLVEIILAIGYFGYLDGVKQQTIGKKLVGIKVVDSATGGPIGIGRSILRQIVLAITGAACFIGYFSPFFDGTKRMQGWHDKASNDFVVTAK